MVPAPLVPSGSLESGGVGSQAPVLFGSLESRPDWVHVGAPASSVPVWPRRKSRAVGRPVSSQEGRVVEKSQVWRSQCVNEGLGERGAFIPWRLCKDRHRATEAVGEECSRRGQ